MDKMDDLTADQIIAKLGLVPLPDEGGLYRQTYISDLRVTANFLPERYTGDRALATHIYYLLTDRADSFSAMHRLCGDEVYHFYLGDPVEMLLLFDGGHASTVRLGQDILQDEFVQYVVPHGVWQGARLAEGGKFALMGTSMSPGYDNTDFELGNRENLLKKYPAWASMIRRLTR